MNLKDFIEFRKIISEEVANGIERSIEPLRNEVIQLREDVHQLREDVHQLREDTKTSFRIVLGKINDLSNRLDHHEDMLTNILEILDVHELKFKKLENKGLL